MTGKQYVVFIGVDAWNYRLWYARTQGIRKIMWSTAASVLHTGSARGTFDSLSPVQVLVLLQGSLQKHLRRHGPS